MRKQVLTLLIGAGLLLGTAAAQAENLLEVYQQALTSDPQLRAAAAVHSAALEAKPQAEAPLLPQLSLSGGVSHSRSDTTQAAIPTLEGKRSYTTRSYSLNLQQALYHRDYFAQLKQADAKVAQADAQYEAARQDLIVRVAQAYFNILAAQDNLDFAQAEKKAFAHQLDQAQQRYKVGLSAITDVKEAKASYDLSVASEITAQNQLDTSHEALREIIGQPPATIAPLAQVHLISPHPADIKRWVQTALSQNLTLLANQAAVQVAKEEVERQRSGHYPSLDVVASDAYTNNIGAGFGTKGTDASIGLQLSIPLYAGGAVSSRTRQAADLYSEAQDNMEKQHRTTVLQTRDAYLTVEADISHVEALKQSLASTQTALEATQAGFEVGTRTIVDVLNAEQQVFGAKRDYAKARYDYIMATLKLKQAAGTLNTSDLKQINAWLK